MFLYFIIDMNNNNNNIYVVKYLEGAETKTDTHTHTQFLCVSVGGNYCIRKETPVLPYHGIEPVKRPAARHLNDYNYLI